MFNEYFNEYIQDNGLGATNLRVDWKCAQMLRLFLHNKHSKNPDWGKKTNHGGADIGIGFIWYLLKAMPSSSEVEEGTVPSSCFSFH